MHFDCVFNARLLMMYSPIVLEAHPRALPPGHRIDEYEIVRVLGIGGFGITYLAFDHRLDGPVAIKEYFPIEVAARSDGRRVAALSTESREVFAWGLDGFIQEARAIHKFRHANVVRAHRYIETHGTAYIVMEYVEGEPLQAILDVRGRLPMAAWRPWLNGLLDGLAHVHDHGYLHRDIKPANIVIRAVDREPVLIDFGAARVAVRERTRTQVLTPGYAPIEQYASRGDQGQPTDIYALAAVSYRALTGEPPPEAPDRMLDDRCEPLAGRIDGADRAWLAAIDQALAPRPADRPATVDAWRAALRGAERAVDMETVARLEAAARRKGSGPSAPGTGEASPSGVRSQPDIPGQHLQPPPGRARGTGQPHGQHLVHELQLNDVLLLVVAGGVLLLWLVAFASRPAEQPAAARIADAPSEAGVTHATEPRRPPPEPVPAGENVPKATNTRDAASIVTSPAAVEAGLGLDSARKRAIQQGLVVAGFDPGTADGLFGPATRAALRAWQASRGIAATGYLDAQQATILVRSRAGDGSDHQTTDGRGSAPSRRNPSRDHRPRGGVDFSGVSAGDRATIERTCQLTTSVTGPAAYYRCVARQVADLRATPRPDFRGTSAGDRAAIERTCQLTTSVTGPAAYYRCVARQVADLRATPRPDFRGTNAGDRAAIERTCELTTSVTGPAAYYRCVATQVADLRAAPRPDFRGVSARDRAAIERTCQLTTSVTGPAAYYRCVATQVADLRAAPRPDFRGVNARDRAAIERTCQLTTSVTGPATYYRCVARQVADLRTTRSTR